MGRTKTQRETSERFFNDISYKNPSKLQQQKTHTQKKKKKKIGRNRDLSIYFGGGPVFFFFYSLNFFFFRKLGGGTMAPAGPPFPPSLRIWSLDYSF
jgi:hypothetical protein